MAGGDEAVLGGQPLEPGIELALPELHHPVAPVADEVMVMPVAAPAIAKLPLVVREDVDRTRVREEAERAVHRGEPEPLAALPEPRVQVLRRHVVVLATELGGHGDALMGCPQAEGGKRLLRRAKGGVVGPACRTRHG